MSFLPLCLVRCASLFDQPAVQKYMSRKWRGGRELQWKLDSLSEELLERAAMKPKEWKLTAAMTRLFASVSTSCEHGSAVSTRAQEAEFKGNIKGQPRVGIETLGFGGA